MTTFAEKVLIAGSLMLANAQGAIAAPTVCSLEMGPTRTITKILDSETLGLEDGSEVRLIGALGPRARDAQTVAGLWGPEQDAIALLRELALGKAAKLGYGGQQTDRYGRHLAHVFVLHADGNIWLQGELVSAGMARTYVLPGNTSCIRELLTREREAIAAQRGLWANPLYRLKPAAKPNYLLTLRNKYERVLGDVASVSTTKSAIYLNFGDDWKSDFTARIARSLAGVQANFESALLDSTGKRVVIRGWIERRNGPLIDVIDPSQIEGLDDTPPASAPPSKLPDEMPSPATHIEKPGGKDL